jgi:xanthine dioxygenase
VTNLNTLKMKITPIEHPKKTDLNGFGAIIEGGVALTELDDREFDLVRQALYEFQFLVFKNQQDLHPKDQAIFFRRFDPAPAVCRGDDSRQRSSIWRDLECNPWELEKTRLGNHDIKLKDCPEILVIGQGDYEHDGTVSQLGGAHKNYGMSLSNSQVVGGNQLQWHIDGAFYQTLPPAVTGLLCKEAPSSNNVMIEYGGGTLGFKPGSTAIVSGTKAYEMLSDEDKQWLKTASVHYGINPFSRVLGLSTSDDGINLVDDGRDYTEAFEREAGDPGCMTYPMLWTNPVTGKTALQVHTRCMLYIEAGGKRLGVLESRELLHRLMKPAVDPSLVYCHGHEQGDLTLWDNFSVWHSATGGLAPDDHRVMHMASFNGSSYPVYRGI